MILDRTLVLTNKDVEILKQEIPSDKKIHSFMKEIQSENNKNLEAKIEPWMKISHT
ncbi:hypothetical protein [Leuconostoc lactis]|uniref:hypothetical protein n=1 Tax=Leuconostoc lactis TaxID=1246 RepID=UPI0024AD82C0|nr:hypothetical protein [Leuconostoc lactis]MDI6496858.1 hypothetical protein [Leuconostoc lactis]